MSYFHLVKVGDTSTLPLLQGTAPLGRVGQGGSTRPGLRAKQKIRDIVREAALGVSENGAPGEATVTAPETAAPARRRRTRTLSAQPFSTCCVSVLSSRAAALPSPAFSRVATLSAFRRESLSFSRTSTSRTCCSALTFFLRRKRK